MAFFSVQSHKIKSKNAREASFLNYCIRIHQTLKKKKKEMVSLKIKKTTE